MNTIVQYPCSPSFWKKEDTFWRGAMWSQTMHLYCCFTDRVWPSQTLQEQDSLLPWTRATLVNDLSSSPILMVFKPLVVVPNMLPGPIMLWCGEKSWESYEKSRPLFQWNTQKQSFPPGDFADVTVQETPPACTQLIMTKCPGVLLLAAQAQEQLAS